MTRTEMLASAIQKKYPNAKYSLKGMEILEWHDASEKPSEVEVTELVEVELSRLAREAYKERRAKEYPSVGDQLDALWKGGKEADDMRVRIQAVKDKYPKPA